MGVAFTAGWFHLVTHMGVALGLSAAAAASLIAHMALGTELMGGLFRAGRPAPPCSICGIVSGRGLNFLFKK